MSDYLTLDDLAERWGIPYGTLVVRRHRGKLPAPDVDKPNKPLWAIETIEDYERETKDGHRD